MNLKSQIATSSDYFAIFEVANCDLKKEEVIMTKEELIISDIQTIENRIFVFRSKQVMLDRDLAELYGVETKVLNQSVKRNKDRFPEEFCFQLNEYEFMNWRSQFVTLKKKK